VKFYAHIPAYEDGTESSETSAYKIQKPGNHPKENIQHSGQRESLKSRKLLSLASWVQEFFLDILIVTKNKRNAN